MSRTLDSGHCSNLKSFTCALCWALDSVVTSDINALICADLFSFKVIYRLYQTVTSSELHNIWILKKMRFFEIFSL